MLMTNKSEDEAVLSEMTNRLEMLESKLHVAKIAYLHRTPLNGKPVEFEDLKAIADEYIRMSYALQKVKYGSVRFKISSAKLLR